MSVTNHAVGESINLATVLNTKLEAPVLQSEMGLDSAATVSGNAVRWNEFSLKHNNDGSFKGIDQADIKLSTSASASGNAVRYNEFSLKHNSDGSFKGIDQADMKLTTLAMSTQKPVRWDEFSVKHNNDGSFKNPIQMYAQFQTSNPSATANTYGILKLTSVPTNYTAIVMQGMDIVLGGTFGTSETVTATVEFTYSDSSVATLNKTATAVGTISLTNSDIMSLIKSGLYINQITVESKSSIASSTVTTTFNHWGMFI